MIETIAYKEQSDHEFIHVTTTDKNSPGHAVFSDDERKVGTVSIASHAGYFEPAEWCFAPEVATGVYKKTDLNFKLLSNMDKLGKS